LAVSSRLRQQLPHLTAHDVHVVDRELRSTLTGVAQEDVPGAGHPRSGRADIHRTVDQLPL
jgi:phage terminase Nu1 subunit (DNA packaging protein)